MNNFCGMDRMGPKWFADIDYRWASPVKNHILCFILGEIGIALYAFRGNLMEGLSVTGLEIVTVFGVTAIAAALFPFTKRARQIWDSSPYKSWKILGIPVVTYGAFFNIVYLAILFYFFIVMPDLEGLAIGSLVLYAVLWGCGILWYFYWKNRNKQVGVYPPPETMAKLFPNLARSEAFTRELNRSWTRFMTGK